MSYIYPTDSRTVSDSFADHVDRGSVNPGTDYVLGAGGEVRSIAAGKVVGADGNPDGSGGRTITVYHDDGSSADYLHLNALAVSVGQRVAQGQRIGFSGGSGYGKNDYYGAHLHITFRPHNQIDWLGNVGNADFDAIMRAQTAPATVGGNATPIRPAEELFVKDAAFKSTTNGTVYLYLVETGAVRVLTGPEWTILTTADPTLKATELSPAQTSAIVNGHLVDRAKGR
jgi:murein DD-endopeptidase